MFDTSSTDNTELKYVVEEGRWHEIKNKLVLSEVEFKISLIKLNPAGLVKEIVGAHLGHSGGHYLITPTFKWLMKLIQYANEPTFNYKIR